MIKEKCPSCGKRISKKFNFCPWCNLMLKENHDRQNLGMLGKNDNVLENNIMGQQIKLPFGINKMMGSLMKQIQRELGGIDNSDGIKMPKGFEIKIQTGVPKQRIQQNSPLVTDQEISDKEKKRRETLPQKEAKSKVKRLADKILYEIDAPGVNKVADVVIIPLEKGIEIRAYTTESCYIKTIPLKVQIEKYGVKNGKVLLELKD